MLADLGDIQIDYSVRGEGPPVLGVMGFALDKRFWAAQIPAVTGSHRFITFDNRGVGRSRGPLPGSVDEMAHDAIRLLDHLEIDKTVLFGMSMGGTIAQRIALDHPERVSALILAVTWARPIEYMRRGHALGRRVAQELGVRELIEVSMLRMFTPTFFEMGRENIDRIISAFFAGKGNEVLADGLVAQIDALDKHDALADLSRIEVPTLVIGGKMDMTVPAFASEEIARAIPGAELHMLDTGHGCMVEEVDAFNGLVARFLARL